MQCEQFTFYQNNLLKYDIMNIQKIMSSLEAKHPGELEYLQAVKEVLLSIEDIYNQHPEFEKVKIIERLVEPDRIFTFRVTWVDDKGEVQTNLGYRVQFNNAIGPYKGGIRFHASVNLSILKFLGFEQTFKNALTTLPMGGGKGGSDFSPRGKSDAEIMRFCQAFMLELWRHLGPDMDVPAGDIGVGGREVGYMFGMYKKLTREFTGTFTGKGLEFGGSLIRPEATGFGGLYFVYQMLQAKNIDIKGKTVAISGFGNVAWGAATKATELGAKVITISGPDGYIYDPDGISGEKIDYMLELRASGNDIVAPYAEKYPGATFVEGKRPWEVKADIALPCATQNELNGEDAQNLIKNNVLCIGEISNMGCTPEAIDLFIEKKIMYVCRSFAPTGRSKPGRGAKTEQHCVAYPALAAGTRLRQAAGTRNGETKIKRLNTGGRPQNGRVRLPSWPGSAHCKWALHRGSGHRTGSRVSG